VNPKSCPSCNSYTRSGRAICHTCGGRLSRICDESAPLCPRCSIQVRAGSHRCHRCGFFAGQAFLENLAHESQARVIRWYVPNGARVVKDQILCEIETNSFCADVQASVDGIVRHLVELGTVFTLGEDIVSVEPLAVTSEERQELAKLGFECRVLSFEGESIEAFDQWVRVMTTNPLKAVSASRAERVFNVVVMAPGSSASCLIRAVVQAATIKGLYINWLD
jgi:hypothetical protein